MAIVTANEGKQKDDNNDVPHTIAANTRIYDIRRCIQKIAAIVNEEINVIDLQVVISTIRFTNLSSFLQNRFQLRIR